MSLFDIVKNQLNRFFPSKQAKIFEQWKKDCAEKFRYEYALDENSVVFDIGGYQGQWAEEILRKFNANLHVFEPVKEYASAMRRKHSENAKIIIYNYGLSDKNISTEITVNGNASSLYTKRGRWKKEKVNLISARDFIEENRIENIDLMKINIEGGEYDLLEHLIETGLIKRIKNIQVQFHNFVPNAKVRMKKIQTNLG